MTLLAAIDIPTLLALAWLLPLLSFALIVFFGKHMGPAGKNAGYLATAAIVGGFLLSLTSLGMWVTEHGVFVESHHGEEHHAEEGSHEVAHSGGHEEGEHQDAAGHDVAGHDAEGDEKYAPITGDWYTLGQFGTLKLSIGYYIDALTICMFTMITLIASCIHFYAQGYMHDELHEITDHEVTLSDGTHLKRPGRYYRFFQYLSLFCFSMLGLVISGNLAMTFVFWELVGICSYFLIGFYIERKSASNAANKAFIVNRVGDFGMIIGLMAIWGGLGTLDFGDSVDAQGKAQAGIFSQVRAEENTHGANNEHTHGIAAPDGFVKFAAQEEIAAGVEPTDEQIETWREAGYGYWLLIIGGLGIFCGCVGKSAQFPLHVWLPDAMEGPTPVSALVHSATMVAAGVFLVTRFFPFFVPEVLLVIAIVGAITLFMAASIAITATDIKRVLAYSTVSQLGYMMFALGVGGWMAGVLHLFTHAFFKSLLFMCSGSVIHAVHTNEMTEMGGLRKKMPWTAYTMLVGCLAIAGAGIPFVIGLSGYYSKDAILAHGFLFRDGNPLWGGMFFIAAGGAAMTAFYMFRLWFLTFSGEPRDQHRYDHAHESPKVMYVPLVVLAVLAAVVVWPSFANSPLVNLLEQSRPEGIENWEAGKLLPDLTYNNEHKSHEDAYHVPATIIATATAWSGFLLALVFYGTKWLDPREVSKQFSGLYRFLVNKWWFDELYDRIFVRPTHVVSKMISGCDKNVLDWFLDSTARWTRAFSRLNNLFDKLIVDGLYNGIAAWTYGIGSSLRNVQTGRTRQYVVSIVVGTLVLFVLITFFWNFSQAAG
jgi:NADH:ubiquinone oxidoreductase subunit 5 (subunit L)/multisubunit Na+/H+ antiporter MnhA subunit